VLGIAGAFLATFIGQTIGGSIRVLVSSALQSVR
jgi:hypothetical protein